MSPLALAIASLIERVSDRDLADALNPLLCDDISEKTAHRLRVETAAGTVTRWDGDRLQALCTWERQVFGATTIADSLKSGTEARSILKSDLHVLLMTAVAMDNRTGEAIANAARDFQYDLNEMALIREHYLEKLKAWAPAIRQLVHQIEGDLENRRRGNG